MLRALPKGWFSHHFTVMDNGNALAEMGLDWPDEAGTLSIRGERFSLSCEGRKRGNFLLEGNSGVLARAEKPKLLSRSLVIVYGGLRYTLDAESFFRRRFLLRTGDQVLGSVYPIHAFHRTALADLPDDIPLTIRLFVVWLVLLLWTRGQGMLGCWKFGW